MATSALVVPHTMQTLDNKALTLFEGVRPQFKATTTGGTPKRFIFAKTVSIFEPLKLMPVNLKCQPHRVVSSAYQQDKSLFYKRFTSCFCYA